MGTDGQNNDTERRITCADADAIRADAEGVSSSLTNWVGGEVLNPDLPPHTATTWHDADGRDVLREVLDADGCRHWAVST